MRRILSIVAVLALVLVSMAIVSCSDDEATSANAISLEDAIGQMLLIGFRGLDVHAELADILDEVRPGGVILYRTDVPSDGAIERNIESPHQLRALIAGLQDQAHIPYFIAIDAEGGNITQLQADDGFSVLVPSHQVLGTGPIAETLTVALDLADELRDLGINWNFAPVVDVNVNPDSPSIGSLGRSFGADPDRVVEHAEAFVSAMRSHDVIPLLKHFPGHGSDDGTTEQGVRQLSQTYQREIELQPFRDLIGDGYDEPILLAHVIISELDPSGRPVSLSETVVTGLLRNDLGFGGVIVSDRVMDPEIVAQYGLGGSAIAAIQAGADVLLAVNQSPGYDLEKLIEIKDAIVEAVEAGDISEERIFESARRIMALKRAYGIVGAESESASYIPATNPHHLSCPSCAARRLTIEQDCHPRSESCPQPQRPRDCSPCWKRPAAPISRSRRPKRRERPLPDSQPCKPALPSRRALKIARSPAQPATSRSASTPQPATTCRS